MVEIFAFIVFTLFYLVGIVGIVLPVLPGVPLAALGAVLAGWLTGFEALTATVLAWVVALALLAQVTDYIGNVIGAKHYGASRPGLWGGIVGSILGLVLLPPFGFLPGALLGAVGAELLTGREPAEALRAGVGALIGTLGGVLVKFIIVIAIGIMVYPRFF